MPRTGGAPERADHILDNILENCQRLPTYGIRKHSRWVPTLAVPDNTKTAVSRACRYDPDLNPTYQEFAVHYGMGVMPARPYKPRGIHAQET